MKPLLSQYLLGVFFALSIFKLNAQPKIKLVESSEFQIKAGVDLTKTNYRALSVADDKVIWVSGSKGTFARSTNGGNSLEVNQIKGYENSDFRDIEAFDEQKAIVMSSGYPAIILKTINGGKTWKEVFRKNDSAYFLDAMDFWDEQRGVMVGDPINGHFVILQTFDAGDTWIELDTTKTPLAMEGEAVFAASGTSLKVLLQEHECCGVAFVTGGSVSRLIGVDLSRKLINWKSYDVAIVQGQSSQGAFSFASNIDAFVVVGGDYSQDTVVNKNSAIQYAPSDKTENIFDPLVDDVKGYRSCVEAINAKSFIACGTTGVDVYKGKYWKNISKEGFNVVSRSKNGKAIFLAGAKGKIAKFIP